MATMVNSVAASISEIDKAVEEINATSQNLKELADESVRASAQFRTT
jgi:methyl-accepting chemotaxis protein